MQVMIPSPLRSYTQKQAVVQAKGSTLFEALQDLDTRFPGLRFRIINEQDRIRTHIKIFVNQSQADSLTIQVNDQDRIHIIAALSGG